MLKLITNIDWNLTATIVYALSSFIIAIFTIVLAKVTYRQARLTKEGIELGNKEFVATHRPRIRVQYVVSSALTIGQVPSAEIHALNFGESNAIFQQIGVDIFTRTKNLPNTGQFNSTPKPWIEIVLPGKDAKMSVHGALPLIKEKIDGILNGNLELCLLGIINYTDGNQIMRSTSFFRIFDPKRGRFIRASQNDEYAEWDYES